MRHIHVCDECDTEIAGEWCEAHPYATLISVQIDDDQEDETMRTRIFQPDRDYPNRVVVESDDPLTGERRMDYYYAPIDGGYVRRGEGEQVTEGLGRRGNTLVWRATSPLINLIRREYRRQRRELKRQGLID